MKVKGSKKKTKRRKKGGTKGRKSGTKVRRVMRLSKESIKKIVDKHNEELRKSLKPLTNYLIVI